MSVVLIVQLVLVFLAPPFLSENFLGLGSKNIFLSDLWCLFWVLISAFYLLRTRFSHGTTTSWIRSKNFLYFFLITTTILTVIYLHGSFRVPLGEYLKESIVFQKKSDSFHAFSEFLTFIRFLSWLLACRIVYLWVTSEANHNQKQNAMVTLQWTLAICLILSSTSLIITSLNPSFKEWFGKFYHYDFNYYWWKERQYGVFPSPVEASATLLFGSILLCIKPLIPLKLFIPTLCFSFLGGLLSHSLTPFISIFFVIAFILNQWLKNPWKWLAPILWVSSILFFFYIFRNHHQIQGKIDDFVFRMKGWDTYLKIALTRWDLLIFGCGFTIYYTDSSYLFLIHKGGLLLVGAFFYSIFFIYKKYWHSWNLSQKCIPIFILTTGIALDFFIFRHAVILMITLGIPLLFGKDKD